MDVPSMVQRSGDTLIVRSVVSGDQIFLDQETKKEVQPPTGDRYVRLQSSTSLDCLPVDMSDDVDGKTASNDEGLPQCKIKRNYSCNSCTFFTQNPRHFLTHLRDIHGEKIVINECKLCLYASRHYQKLVRHMKMVHGSTEGIEDHAQARKRQLGREGRKRKIENSLANISLVHQPIIPPSAKYEDMSSEDTPQNRLLKCSLCEFTTLYRAQLVEHEQEDHCKTKFFRCEKCTYVTHIKARFSKHVKYHSMPMIKCVTCDFRTPYKWNLDRHMKNHGGTGPFKCAACNFTADIKQSLTVHEMNHHVPPVGHAAGMSMARRRNKVGGTDIAEDFISENGDLEDSLNNNNNNIDDYDETLVKHYKYGDEEQPTDLSQKSSLDMQQKKSVRPVPNLIPIQATGNALNLSLVQKELVTDKASLSDLAQYFFGANKMTELMGTNRVDLPQLSPSSTSSAASKKKAANFFDKLKELALDAARNDNLVCSCGHTSKCLSESIIHRNACKKIENEDKRSSPCPINLSINSGSTRCQYCRHRCKSSADLASHVRNCMEAGQCQNDSYDSFSDINERNEKDDSEELHGEDSLKHPMENRIFVWNKLPEIKSESGGEREGKNVEDVESKKHISGLCGENGYYGVETAPGYGEVTNKITSEEEAANSSLKKVYKCPHCPFWAATASRFHVHIVGHLNKKPFECSFCAYRSNWRWDITKHIRLKTIRDPNHKVARVLMNDETGRRNYTKYNKYITLMKVTEEDGDPKLLKSGEMTPHQEASLALLNEYNSGLQKIKVADNNNEEDGKQSEAGTSQINSLTRSDANRFIQMPFFPSSIMGVISPQHEQHSDAGNKSPALAMKPTEDVVTQNINLKLDVYEKKTLYKCRKCNFRNASRDMVLSHVKEHFQEAGIELNQKSNLTTPLQVAVNSNFYANNVFAAMCLSQTLGDKIGKQHHPLLAGSLVQAPTQLTVSVPQSVQSAPSPTVLPLNLGVQKASEHGETDEASCGVVTTTGTGVTGWRNPAPYRCGHCHQVSNWKHVIQRHCRLKHNSDIRIETFDRNSSQNSPVYHPIFTQLSNGSNVLTNNNIDASQSTKVPYTNNQEALISQKSTKSPDLAASFVKRIEVESSTTGTSISIEKSNKEKANRLKQKRHICPWCRFVSDSKSQLNYHISLMHKKGPGLYTYGSYSLSASKKPILVQHCRDFCYEGHRPSPGSKTIVLRANDFFTEMNESDKQMCFCQECPARFIGKTDLEVHKKFHEINFFYRCNKCTFSTRHERDLNIHANVHSTAYQEKTDTLCLKFKENAEFTRPQLKHIARNSTEDYWVIDGNSVCDSPASTSVSDLEDSIQKSVLTAEGCSTQNEELNSKSLLKAQLENDLEPEGCKERCTYCPFETNNSAEYKQHISNHMFFSGHPMNFKCCACDFSTADETDFKDHVKLHILPIEYAKSAKFYTSLNSLELNVENSSAESSEGQTENLFKADDDQPNENEDNYPMDCSSSHRIILDAKTGEIIRKYDEPPSPGSS